MTNFPIGYKVIVASDVYQRDGVGIEVYKDDKLLVEIFRDDTKRLRQISLHKRDLELHLVEASIAAFKEAIPWDFIVDDGRVP
jgi:hypothetical protein